jgi:hypothetical protein
MDEDPTSINEWEIVDFALLGTILGFLVGAVCCCCQLVMNPTHNADFDLVRDAAVGGVVGALMLSLICIVRNRIRRATNFR